MGQRVRPGHVGRAVIGVSIRAAKPEDADAVGLKKITGVVVDAYTDSLTSPAKKAGIEPGDVIVALDGQPIADVPQLQQKVGFKKPGDVVEVTRLRQGGVKTTGTARLAKAPAKAEAEEWRT